MMCILEIACLVFGIIILAKGKVSLSAKKEVRGTPAYLIGLLLFAILPLALAIGLVVGIQKVQQGGGAQFDWSLVMIDLGVVAGCTIPALIIALVTAKPKLKRRSGDGRAKRTTTTIDTTTMTTPGVDGGTQFRTRTKIADVGTTTMIRRVDGKNTMTTTGPAGMIIASRTGGRDFNRGCAVPLQWICP